MECYDSAFSMTELSDLMMLTGSDLAPRDIEQAVESLSFVGRAAAVAIDRGGMEGYEPYVFAELDRLLPPDAERLREMAGEVEQTLHRVLGQKHGRVCLLPPRTLPLTRDGAVRYPALRAAYLDGSLQAKGHILFPEP